MAKSTAPNGSLPFIVFLKKSKQVLFTQNVIWYEGKCLEVVLVPVDLFYCILKTLKPFS